MHLRLKADARTPVRPVPLFQSKDADFRTGSQGSIEQAQEGLSVSACFNRDHVICWGRNSGEVDGRLERQRGSVLHHHLALLGCCQGTQIKVSQYRNHVIWNLKLSSLPATQWFSGALCPHAEAAARGAAWQSEFEEVSAAKSRCATGPCIEYGKLKVGALTCSLYQHHIVFNALFVQRF